MAEIKPIKIDSTGFEHEIEATDEVTYAGLTASDNTKGFAVTGGAQITENITFNAVTDTISGIQNQNLLDKTASETISADWTVATTFDLTLTDAPVEPTDAANKAYVDSVINGLVWQQPVIDKDLTTPPGGPTTGDRYIVAATATGAWAGQEDNIAEYNGATWDFTATIEGFAAWIEDEDKAYVFNGTAWVSFASVYDHNNLSGLQGGTTNEYYHMTSAEDTWLAAANSKVASGGDIVGNSVNDTITATWDVTGEIDLTGGTLEIPTAIDASPGPGGMYTDTGTQKLYVYDGSVYFEVGAAGGAASSVVTTYTAGAGGIAQYDAVYISAADTVLKGDATAISTGKVIGFAPSAITAAASGDIQENGLLPGILAGGGTAGDVYYLSETPGVITTTPPTTSGAVVFRVGVAKNANDLQLGLEFVTIRS